MERFHSAVHSPEDLQHVWREKMWLMAFIGIAVAARIVFVLHNDVYFDDAFITFRYARNLIQGHGLVYQPGEHVYGASSPLYAILCAGLWALVGDALLPSAAWWTGTAGIIIFVLAVLRLFPGGSPARIVTAIALLCYPRIFYSTVGGMEECLVLAFMGLSVCAAMDRRWNLTGLLCGALLFLKVDTIAWCILLFSLIGIWERKVPWKVILISFLVVLPWGAFSELYYGSVIPHAIEAKRVAFAASSQFTLSDIIKLPAPDPLKSDFWAVLVFAACSYGVIVASVVRILRMRAWVLLVFPLYCVSYQLVLVLSGTPPGLWDRWTVPLWGAFIVCFGIWFDGLRSPWLRDQFAALRIRFRAALLILGCALLLIPFAYPERRGLALGSFKEAGIWLRDNGSPGSDVILEPIGMIGYLSGIRIHDFIGLVSPEITTARAREFSNAWYATYLAERLPTFVVLRDVEMNSNEFLIGGYGKGILTAAERTWFLGTYHEVFRTAQGLASNRLVIFSRL